ncbi:hypothetical protein [Sinorhizobium meliloti]|uniref:hypothetical protein n=1 Tax=Rhizobium meliloti TaxID=382 RepID=UPI001F452701|nr:hypothetical protein [Sinorhizobium meliloti]
MQLDLPAVSVSWQILNRITGWQLLRAIRMRQHNMEHTMSSSNLTSPNSSGWLVTFQQLWKTIVSFAAVLAAFVGIVMSVDSRAYTQGKDAGAGALAVYEKSKEFKFEEISARAVAATDDLQKASALFKNILATDAEYATAKEELAKARTYIERITDASNLLSDQVKGLTRSLEASKAELERLTSFGANYPIPVGKSVIIPIGLINFGVQDVSPNGTALIIVSGAERTTRAGDRFEVAGSNNTVCVFNTRLVDFVSRDNGFSVDAQCFPK